MNEEKFATVLKELYAAPAPDDALASRVAALADVPPARPLVRRRFLAVGFAAAALAALALLPPRPLSPLVRPVNALAQMQRAIWNVRRAHAVHWATDKSGQPVKFSEEWFSDGKRRQNWYRDGDVTDEYAVGEGGYWKSQAGMFRIDEDDKTWTYRPGKKTVYVGGVWDAPAPLSLAVMQEGYTRIGIENRIHNLGTATWKNGRQVQTVQVDLPDDDQSYFKRRPARPNGGAPNPSHAYFLLFVDKKTSLPFRQEFWQDDLEGNGFTRRIVTNIEYDTPVDATLFARNFPPGTQVLDQQDAIRLVIADFAKRAVRRTVGGRTVTLYDLFTTETGQNVVAYTVSGGPGGNGRDWQVTLSDRYGRHWTQLDGGPVGRRFPQLRTKYTFDGLPLQVDWLEPNIEVTNELVTDMDVTFHLPEDETTIHSGNGLVSGPMLKAEPYQELMAINAEKLVERTRNNAHYWQDGRWKNDKQWREMVERESYDPLRAAVGWYKLTMRTADECAHMRGEPTPNHSRDLREMADVLDTLGRTREADDARRQADADDRH